MLSMEMEDILLRGPQIIWNRKDLDRMVLDLGFDNAVDRISEGVFVREYVAMMVEKILKQDPPIGGYKESEYA